MKNYYDKLAKDFEKKNPGMKNIYQAICSLTNFKYSDNIIDVGGGTGSLAQFFVDKVKSITVIDPSNKMLKECKKHYGVYCVPGMGEDLPIADNSADKIILVDSFHHIHNQKTAILEIKRILKQNGQVLIVEYNPLTYAGRQIMEGENFLKLGSTFYEPDDLANLFKSFNFKTRLFNKNRKNYYLVAYN